MTSYSKRFYTKTKKYIGSPSFYVTYLNCAACHWYIYYVTLYGGCIAFYNPQAVYDLWKRIQQVLMDISTRCWPRNVPLTAVHSSSLTFQHHNARPYLNKELLEKRGYQRNVFAFNAARSWFHRARVWYAGKMFPRPSQTPTHRNFSGTW